MNESQRPVRLLVVGLGRPDRGDDAVGPIVARRFAGLRVPGIRVLEREDPTSLIELWDPEEGRADLAIVVDAVRSHEVPGTLTILETGSQRNPLPADAWTRTGRCGTHPFGLAESIELARALHRLPRRVVLVGIEAATFEHGAPLSPASPPQSHQPSTPSSACCGTPGRWGRDPVGATCARRPGPNCRSSRSSGPARSRADRPAGTPGLADVGLRGRVAFGVSLLPVPSTGSAVHLTEKSYVDDDFADVELSGESIDGVSFVDCDFADASLVDVKTKGATFERCSFVGTEWYGSSHQGTSFLSCTFERSAWHGASLTGCRLIGSTFTDCRLLPLTVRDCDLTLVSLAGAKLAGVDLSGLRLREANLVGADFSGCNLRGADLTGARAERLDLTGADLRGARVDAATWVGARLAGAVVDVDQAVLFAAAHGLVLSAPEDAAG